MGKLISYKNEQVQSIEVKSHIKLLKERREKNDISIDNESLTEKHDLQKDKNCSHLFQTELKDIKEIINMKE